jgi:hypothetical protein
MFITDVNDTSDKLLSGVNDTGEKFIALIKCTSKFSLLLQVSLTPVINIHSRISRRICVKILNGPNGILRVQEKLIHEITKKAENLVSDSL